MRKRFLILIALMLLTAAIGAGQSSPKDQSLAALPDQLGRFRAAGQIALLPGPVHLGDHDMSGEYREYQSTSGSRLSVTIRNAVSDAQAYSTFLSYAAELPPHSLGTDVGARSVLLTDRLLFFKGPHFVTLQSHGSKNQKDSLIELGRAVAQNLSSGEGDIPVLVKHLPRWEQVQEQLSYAVRDEQLKTAIPNQTAIDAVSFEGGTEAVIAPYGKSKLVLIEFTTPQLATDNDQRITSAIQQARSQAQAVPTAYRRIGNYAAFVFDGESEQSANKLIDEIKYEQVVQWLGDNPNWLKRAQKEYTETTLGVLVTVVKTSGIAAALCFGIGGFFGAILFARRRARQVEAEAFSDAGGMMRLNLDELSAQTNAGKLIGSGSSDKL